MLTANRITLYPAPGGILLRAGLLRQLGLTIANSIADDDSYGVVTRESNGLLSVFISEFAPEEVTLNYKPLAARARRLLRENDVLGLGQTDLRAVASKPLPITIHQQAVVFPDMAGQVPEETTFSLTVGGAAWRGRLLSAVDWVRVNPVEDVRLPPNRLHTWTLSLNEEALNLADGQHKVVGGLWLLGAPQAVGIDLQMAVRRPLIALHSEGLDLGEVEFGLNTEQELELSVSNYGRGAWAGEIRANVSWLKPENTSMSGETWAESKNTIRFAPNWQAPDAPSVGLQQVPNALIISPRGEAAKVVAAKIKVLPARGRFNAHNVPVSFGEVEINAPPPSASLVVDNPGGAAWRGRLRARNGWVQFAEAGPELALEILPGASKQISLELVDVPSADLNTVLLVDQIDVAAEGDSVAYAEPIQVHLTLIQRPPYLAAQTVSLPPFVRGDQPEDGALTIYNLGPATWQGSIASSLSWLRVAKNSYVCAANEAVVIPLLVGGKGLDQLPLGISQFEGALVVTGGRTPLDVTVQADVRATPTEFHLETPTLNFGLVAQAGPAREPETLRLLNAGIATWQGVINLEVAWLSFEGAGRQLAVEVPKQTQIELPILINDAIFEQESLLLDQPTAIKIDGGGSHNGQSAAVRAMAIISENLPRLRAEPSSLQLDAQLAQSVRIRNTGKRGLDLELNHASWLALDKPNAFSLKPNQEISFTVSLASSVTTMAATTLSDPRALVVVGSNIELEIAVTATFAGNLPSQSS
jgi:hypothetical protein